MKENGESGGVWKWAGIIGACGELEETCDL